MRWKGNGEEEMAKKTEILGEMRKGIGLNNFKGAGE